MPNKKIASKIPAIIIGIMAAAVLIMSVIIVVRILGGYKQHNYTNIVDYISRINHENYASVTNDINRYYFVDLDGSEEMNNMKAIGEYYDASVLYYAYINEPDSQVFKDAKAILEERTDEMGEFKYVAEKIDEQVRNACNPIALK